MKKVPFANSGEIACRIGRACQKLDLASVAIHPQIEVNHFPSHRPMKPF